MMTLPEGYNLFVLLFCWGVAVITSIEASQSSSLLISSNSKQVFLGIRRVPRLSKRAFLGLSFLFSILLSIAGLQLIASPVIFLVCFILYFLIYGQLSFLGRKTNLYPFVLLFFTLHPYIGGDQASFNGEPWTLLFVKTTLAMVYFVSFIQKVKRSWSVWISGERLQSILLYHDSLNETNWNKILINRNIILKVLSIGALLFEAFFWISIFFPTYDSFFGIVLLLFHLSNWVFFRINYFTYYLPILILYFIK